jgi:hypothetical protein
VTASPDGTIRVWPVPALDALSQRDITTRLDGATSAEIDSTNRATTVSPP